MSFNPQQLPVEEQVGRLLLSRGLTMGTAESCTGGRIAHLITSVPGSSAYFQGGVVSYNNQVKQEVLGVSAESLQEWGAVSRQVVEQMARGVQKLLHCDCAVATSGIAGPGGGTKEKPVGTVWIAAVCREEIKISLFYLKGDRLEIIAQSADQALKIMLGMLHKSIL